MNLIRNQNYAVNLAMLVHQSFKQQLFGSHLSQFIDIHLFMWEEEWGQTEMNNLITLVLLVCLTGGMSFDKLIKIQLIHRSSLISHCDWLTDWLSPSAHSVGVWGSWCEDVNKQSQHEEQRTHPAQECSSRELPLPPFALQWEGEEEVGVGEVGGGGGHGPLSLQSRHIQRVVDSECAARPVR